MFKVVQVPIKVFDLDVIKPKARAIYSKRESYFCPIDNEFKDYKSYTGVIESVCEYSLRFISDDTHVNFYSDSEHPDKDIWLSPDDIDNYWIKLELEK